MSEGIECDTTRLAAASDADAARIAERDRNARKNLAAMCCDWYDVRPGQRNLPAAVGLAARDFRLLADMLGLDAPDRGPGTCRGCGGPMSLSRQMNKNPLTDRRLCTTCERSA